MIIYEELSTQSFPQRARESQKPAGSNLKIIFSIHLRVLKSKLGLIISWDPLQNELKT